VLTGGRFRFGLGSGEALNEHILGDVWPEAGDRLGMLEESIEMLRKLFSGERISHQGTHYTVQNARLYTVPEVPVPLYVSGFGPAYLLTGAVMAWFAVCRPLIPSLLLRRSARNR
jgi:alkanesulfonate monooxygenase SsuD/methylene tetrahydromethanopterin reductase-like flavin-dependent oxidoreductase (luciferase family)